MMNESDQTLMTKLQDLDASWNPKDPSVSEAEFRAMLPYATQLEGRGKSLLIELKALLARALGAQNKFGEARASLDEAAALLEQPEAAPGVAAKIRWLMERGRLHILEKTPSQARALFAEAWTLAVNSGEDYFAVEIAQLMAATEPQKAQTEWILRAIQIAETSPLAKTKRWLGSLYTTLGWKQFDVRQYDKALEVFQKAVSHLKAQGTEREAFVARWSIGKVLRALGKTEEALTIQKALLSELGIGGARDGRLYEEMAECLQTLKRTTEAQLYFELAYRELSEDEWVNDNQPLKLKRMKDLGKVK
jgi:tetratricopeptide (TPR) repeat protein